MRGGGMRRSPVVSGRPIVYNVIQKNMPGGLPVRVQGKIPREEVRIVQQMIFGGAEA